MLEAHANLRGGVKPVYEARPRGRRARLLGSQPLATGPPVFHRPAPSSPAANLWGCDTIP
jgi:hypothetical protein